MKTPLPLLADAYTISGEMFAGRSAVEKSVYNMTNRISPRQAVPEVAKDSRMVLYGLSEFISRHLTTPVTHDDVDRAAEFMRTAHSFGGPLNWPEKTWRRVVDEHQGLLPIRITALREGSTFFPYEPVIEVTSLGKGFGEIAAHVEAVMLGMVSTMSARATIVRHWLDRIREEFIRNSASPKRCLSDLNEEELAGIDAFARFFIHDFGMRASSCAEESELLGMAHLLVFHGTDTFNAAYQAMQRGAQRPTGTSIFALAHRIVQGHTTEEDAYLALAKAAGANGIASYVADCYNFHGAVTNYLLGMAKSMETTIVARPDSGDLIENCLFLANQARSAGLTDRADRPSMTRLRFIQGDSVSPKKAQAIFDALYEDGFNSAGCGIFGVGGWLRNTALRDTFSSAYKLASHGQKDTWACKLSDTPAKMSIPGKTIIRRGDNACFSKPSVFMLGEIAASDERIVYYTGSGLLVNESFANISRRTIEDFDYYRGVPDNYGESTEWGCSKDTHDVLSDGLRSLQRATLERHKTSNA